MKPRQGQGRLAWLLMKKKDEHARVESDCDVIRALPDSVLKALPAAPQSRVCRPGR